MDDSTVVGAWPVGAEQTDELDAADGIELDVVDGSRLGTGHHGVDDDGKRNAVPEVDDGGGLAVNAERLHFAPDSGRQARSHTADNELTDTVVASQDVADADDDAGRRTVT